MGDRDLIRVVDVDYIKDYTMDLKVSNGETRCVDFLPLFKKAFPGDVFLRLMVSFMVCGKATSLYAFSAPGWHNFPTFLLRFRKIIPVDHIP